MNTAVFNEVMSCSLAPVCHTTRRHFPQKGIIHSRSYEQLKSLYVHYIPSSLYEITQPCHSHQQWKVPYSFMQVLNTYLVGLILITFQIHKIANHFALMSFQIHMYKPDHCLRHLFNLRRHRSPRRSWIWVKYYLCTGVLPYLKHKSEVWMSEQLKFTHYSVNQGPPYTMCTERIQDGFHQSHWQWGVLCNLSSIIPAAYLEVRIYWENLHWYNIWFTVMLFNWLLGIFKCLLNSFNLAVTIHVECFILQHIK